MPGLLAEGQAPKLDPVWLGEKTIADVAPIIIRSRADFEQTLTGYDASIAYTDHHIGQVLEELDHQGVVGREGSAMSMAPAVLDTPLAHT